MLLILDYKQLLDGESVSDTQESYCYRIMISIALLSGFGDFHFFSPKIQGLINISLFRTLVNPVVNETFTETNVVLL